VANFEKSEAFGEKNVAFGEKSVANSDESVAFLSITELNG
jgi:hypothetical protein